MGVQSKENSLENFKLGLFSKETPPPPGFDFMEDDVGNILEDDEGNQLAAPN